MIATTRTSTLAIRELAPSHPEFRRALMCATGHSSGSPPAEEEFQRLSRQVAQPGFSLRVWTAVEQGKIRASAAALILSGGSAIAMAAGDSGPPDALSASLGALRTAVMRDGVRLVQALVIPEEERLATGLSRAGFRRLTRLVYLQRDAALQGQTGPRTDIRWMGYSRRTRPLFLAALKASYVETLDCPELSALRSPTDALAAHEATGRHDPRLWWLAMCRGEPAGLVLLSRIEATDLLELVYIGVAQPIRGQGFADVLLQRAVRLCRAAGATAMTLACDARNHPAMRLYHRWCFEEFAQRDAWIATPEEFEV